MFRAKDAIQRSKIEDFSFRSEWHLWQHGVSYLPAVRQLPMISISDSDSLQLKGISNNQDHESLVSRHNPRYGLMFQIRSFGIPEANLYPISRADHDFALDLLLARISSSIIDPLEPLQNPRDCVTFHPKMISTSKQATLTGRKANLPI